MPKKAKYTLPEGKLSYSFNINNRANFINITTEKRLDKLFFLPTEYPLLKTITSEITNKESEYIVLLKQ